ncbi:hypothetical protein TOPH_02114 [Tolypocladium ophioglossoides CBS 100239]|uniref:Uncharacterized protein n=1 Tax=Tolypocladium ophioglossoides (strain CBS 100239) TaxID=1163406 RepID=A0A0L0NG39_TOLOC|nr:hypothetical protein TOPH_02114 [Tolypocladium ophioglossoides CBS 100239]
MTLVSQCPPTPVPDARSYVPIQPGVQPPSSVHRPATCEKPLSSNNNDSNPSPKQHVLEARLSTHLLGPHHLGPHHLELPGALDAALLLGGGGELAPHDLLLGPAARRDAHAGDEARGDEERADRRRLCLPARASRAARGRRGEDQGLAAVEEVGADVLELAELGFVALDKPLRVGGVGPQRRLALPPGLHPLHLHHHAAELLLVALLGALCRADDGRERVVGCAVLDERILVLRCGRRLEAPDVSLELLGAHAVGGAFAARALEFASQGRFRRDEAVDELLLLADVVLEVLDLGLGLTQVAAVFAVFCLRGCRGAAVPLRLVHRVLHATHRLFMLGRRLFGLLSCVLENLFEHNLLVFEVVKLPLQLPSRLCRHLFSLAAPGP